MTREEAKELIPIIQAFADGKTIEFFKQGEWMELNEPDFIWSADKYRIKPEPKYRPFKTQEECWEEMHKHSNFGWLKYKFSNSYCPIEKVDDFTNYSGMFEACEFTDGTPFGIKEE